MSLYGAMFSGVSGLSSQSSAMGAIADNIANVNTIGYKGTSVSFSTLVTKQTATTNYAPGGVMSRPRQNIDIQGLLQATNSSTDLSISGTGFMVVNAEADPATTGSGLFSFTRAGSFKVDSQGYLVNTGGYYLQGWPLMRADTSAPSSSIININGTDYMRAYTESDAGLHYINSSIVNEVEMKPLNLYQFGGTAVATSEIQLGANLPSGDAIGGTRQTSVLVYDSLGNSHNVDWTWTKTAAGEWGLSASPPSEAQTIELLNSSGGVYYAQGQIEFTGTFDATAAAALDGAVITIDGVSLTFDNTANMAAGDNTIGTLNATSWADIISEIEQSLSPADARVAADSANPDRLLLTQSGAGAAMVVTFTDNAGNGLLTYSPTFGDGAGFTVAALDATLNFANDPAVTFNGDGTPSAINVTEMEIEWANGAEHMTGADNIDLFLGDPDLTTGLTNLSGSYQVNYLTQDGARFGNFAGVNISSDGVVTALFDNGVRRPIFQIPIATFVNPNGLESLTGNAWIETDGSGAYTLHTAGEAGSGTLEASALEGSTVDIATEFTTMITTQRAYSAASKVITTANDMLDDLLRVIR